MQERLKELIKAIPHSPGCYKYFNAKGELIYIGKAKDLKKRVTSYFIGENDPKTTVLVQNIADIKWEITDSEIEALILESLLIKKYKPRYNIKTKDDKDFLWVKIDKGQGRGLDSHGPGAYPMPELVRRGSVGATGSVAQKEGRTSGSPLRGTKFFGPFTDAKLLREGLAVLRKVFLWRDCSDSKFSYYKKRGKPCLEYYIKNCMAPCQFENDNRSQQEKGSRIRNNDNEYRKGIRQLTLFLEGKKEGIVKSLKKEMESLAKKKRFEEAGVVRDKLRALEHIGAALNSKFQITNDKQISNNKSQNSNEQILKNTIKILNKDLRYDLKLKKDFRIEFYDISNISGADAVGSMVVSVGGELARDQYRRFKVRGVSGPNDIKMLREVLARRLQKISNKSSMTNEKKDSGFLQVPGLIVLDGGRPQLREIAKLFQELKVDIPLLGLAKEEEEVVGINYKLPPFANATEGRQITNNKKISNFKFQILNIKKNSVEGFFLQRLRDEAHRFAIGYHKALREKKIIRSRLDDIEGVGPKTKKKLLLKFGSVEGIMGTSLEELEKVVGKKLAQKVKDQL